MVESIKNNWPEYLIEAAGLGVFMISAGTFGTLLGYPGSPIAHLIHNPTIRQLCMGILMGMTAIAIIYSPWGRRSGAHLNPSVTFTYWTLGIIESWDAIFYAVFQLVGGTLGVYLVLLFFGSSFADSPVSYVLTKPGDYGVAIAFLGELSISFLLMTVVLTASNSALLSPYTGVLAGSLIASFITFEAPLSGMSMNPARTFASAFPGELWGSLWIYFTAPIFGMQLAAGLHRLRRARVYCAKLYHGKSARCIFRCNYNQLFSRSR